MADKPSRGLVLYGDGLMPLLSPSHTHLHQLASRASCGFLSLLSSSPPQESEDERLVREFAQLLDAYDLYISRTQAGNLSSASEDLGVSSMSTISERFMGLKAAILTNDSSIKSFAGVLGFTVLHFDELIVDNQSPMQPTVSGLLKLLGFQGDKVLETCEFDLVFVHIGCGGNQNNQKVDISSNDIELFNELVGGTLQKAQPGSEVSSRLHFSVVMSYGAFAEDSNFSLQEEINPNFSLLFPRQSFTITKKDSVDKTRFHCPMLIAQLQDAVTRKDMAENFSFKEFKSHGGNLAIPADRFLHEVAFKLWKAPKYGA